MEAMSLSLREMEMPEFTKEQLRERMLKIRDEILELNGSWITYADRKELSGIYNEYDMYNAYMAWNDLCRKVPYDNPIARILEKTK